MKFDWEVDIKVLVLKVFKDDDDYSPLIELEYLHQELSSIELRNLKNTIVPISLLQSVHDDILVVRKSISTFLYYKLTSVIGSKI